MIVLDMIKKTDVPITHKHYSLENGIFTLQIDVGDYDLTNKIITAKFNPKEVETGNLDVIDGIINLPIYSNLLKYGINYIQLNFRWDIDKLEQSPKMVWIIDNSLETEGVAEEDIDIISYLINEIQEAKATADRMIEDAGDVRIELDESTASATAINNTLADPVTGTIKLATDANATLSQSIIDAGAAKDALTDPVTGAIVLAEAAEDTLTNPITGAIKLAEDAKEDIEQAIIDNEIVTQTEFIAHKEDYTKLVEDVTELSHITQKYTVDSWQKVQDIVRAGLGDKAFRVGDQLVAQYNGVDYTWDIIGINHDTPTDDTKQYSMTIQTHDCIMNCQFDAPEALYYAEEELPAGEHVFMQDGSGDKYKIITTQPIPAGGQIYVYSWTDYVPAKATTYAADKASIIEDNIDVTLTNDEETLGETNVRARCRYASNNYLESNIRHWLNSEDDAYVWVPQTKYDRPSTGAPYTGGGFLKLLDPELAAIIGPVDKQVARNTVTDGGGQDLFSDKVFLLSRVEVGFGTEGTTTGESVYPYYSGVTDAGRIKLLSGSPRFWWLRSPYVGNSYYAWYVNTSGVLYNYSAIYARGLSPACVII